MAIDPLLSQKGNNSGKKPSTNNTVALIVSAICGVVFGFALQKGHVYEPPVIRGQMLLQQWSMMKMFLSAAATSVVALAIIVLVIPGGRGMVMGARSWAFTGYRGTVAALLGGITIGTGMSLAGACPGTVLIQVGSGVRWSLLTVAGAFVGAFAFAILEPNVLKSSGILQAGMASKPTWDSLLNVPYVVVAAVMATLFAGAVYYIETYISPSSFLKGIFAPSYTLHSTSWPAWLSGIIAGSLQFPMLIFVSETLGASRAYVTLVANALYLIVPDFVRRNSYLMNAKNGTANWSQVLFVSCACLGSFFSCYLSGSSFSSVSGFTPISSFIGGILIVFGGRLAGGCTSGQGLSGNAVLAINGMVATAGIFLGGIPAARFAHVSNF